jgi:acyl-coenzyme A synthetase/AMP-(fatty) acid ligase
VAHAIPRNPSGKIQKHLLRAELAGTGLIQAIPAV